MNSCVKRTKSCGGESVSWRENANNGNSNESDWSGNGND
jgi:hypothetical protein